MAVWTYGPEILHRINLVLRPDGGERLEVMDVDESLHHLSVHSDEVEAAKVTLCSVMPDTLVAGTRITLIAIDQNLLHAAFAVS